MSRSSRKEAFPYESESFKQFTLPSLIPHIQNILRKYPDDGQILKEIIQNAEDAQAEKVVFIYDDGLYGQDGEHQILKGPKLYAYNDAQFEKEDWEGIKSIGVSNKIKDPQKIGRFGLGFKSVFHLTDVPIVASGEIMVYLDPAEIVAPTPVHFEQLESGKNICGNPFENLPEAFSIKDGYCNGSLFCFPLRKEGSEVSRTVYDDFRLIELIKMFTVEGHLNILFLRNVNSIEIYKNSTDGINLWYSVKKEEREKENEASDEKKKKENILRRYFKKVIKFNKVVNLTVGIKLNKSTQKNFTYAVSEQFGLHVGGHDTFLDEDINYLPALSIAYPIKGDDPGGHVFCGLPLPLQETRMTGLPVHVQGYFALGEDRKDLIWKSGTSITDQRNKNAMWNQQLINFMLPDVYVNLIKFLKKVPGSSVDAFYQCWPISTDVVPKWNSFLSKFYKKILDEKCVFVDESNEWATVKSCYFFSEAERLEVDFQALITILFSTCQINVSLPPRKNQEILSTYTNLKLVSKDLVKYIVKENISTYNYMFNTMEKVKLLNFMVQDTEDYHDLKKEKIFPLRFSNDCTNLTSKCFILQDEKDVHLFPMIHDRILSTEGLTHTAMNILQNIPCTGKSTLVWLNDYKIKLNIIKEYLPKDFVTEASKANLHIPINEIKTQFSILAWLKEFWDFVEMNKVPFGWLENLLVLQTMKGSKQYLSKLTSPPTTVLFEYEDLELPSMICDLFHNIGIGIAYHLTDNLQHDMNFVDLYVWRPSPNGIVEVLSNVAKVVGEDFIIESFNQFANEGMLQHLLQQIENYSKVKLPDLFKKIKLFQAFGKRKMVSYEEACFVDKRDLPPHFKTANVNFVTNEFQVLKKFDGQNEKMKGYNKILLFTLRYHKRFYNNFELKKVYDFYANNTNTLECDHTTLEELKKHITVATGISSIRRYPYQLFKKEKLLEKIFIGQSDIFPNPSYNMEILSFLGLKCLNDIGKHDLEKCIISIRMKDSTFVNQKVKALLKVSKKLGISLVPFQDMDWLPVQEKCPRDYPTTMPFHVNQKKLDAPSQTILPISTSSAGAKFSVVQESIAEAAEGLLNFKTPTITDVINQLKLLSRYFRGEDHWKYQDQVQNIYKVLSVYQLSDLSPNLDFNFIWNGQGFIGKDEVVLEATEIDLNPYFCTFPELFPEFKMVLDSLNIGTQPEIKYYIRTLAKIRESHEAEEEINLKRKKADLLLCISILEYLSNHSDTIEEEERHQLDFPLHQIDRSNNLLFKKPDQCFYLEFNNLCEGDVDYIEYDIVHESIEEEWADKLGIRHVESVFVNDGETLFEPWGQSEPLTTRLNRLLLEYVDGLPIPKEMIQNADDAGAKEVRFLFDQRENKKFKGLLFDEKMQNWQGSALWVYNDAKFTDQDFKNLIHLNASKKEIDGTKIGKFGLGFNSVYHLTDVPSLLSGDSLVIFDPHFKYLKNVLKNPTMPGVKVQIKNKKLAKFKDQLQIFNGVFGAQCNLYEGKVDQFNGTLFRLPFRNHFTSRSSDICKTNYNAEEVMYLLEMLEKCLDHLLLFTEHVEKVSVYHLDVDAESPKEMKMLYSLQRSETYDSVHRESLLEISRKILEGEYIGSEVNIIKDVSMNINVTGAYSNLLQSICKQTFSPKQYEKCEYLVSNFTGNTISMEKARRMTGVLPCAGVAIKLKPENTGGKLFCFLPLPIESYLPVHVNATFEVTSCRGELKSISSDCKQTMAYNWNDVLAEDISKAYYYLILELKERFKDIRFDDWIRFLPHSSNEEGNIIKSSILKAVKQFYSQMLNHDAIFPLSMEDKKHIWISFKNMCYFDIAFPRTMIQPCLRFMNLFFNPLGYYFVEMPKEMYNTLSWLKKDKRNFDIKSVFDVFFKVLGIIELELTLHNYLLTYALTHFQDEVKTHSCIPTIPNGTLRKPCDLILPKSKISILYQENDHVFPIENVKSYSNILMSLGMKSENLSSLQIIDRAKHFAKIGKEKDTSLQINVLLSLIRQQIPSFIDQDRKELTSISFLPVLKKPDDYPYKIWFGEKGGLHPSTNMHLKNYTFVCGPTSYIFSAENIDFELAEFLGLAKAPDFNKFQENFPQMFKDIEVSNNSRMIMKQIYQYIESLPTHCLEKLKGENVILTDSGKLISSKLTVKNISDEIPGYLYKFPAWIEHEYQHLTEELEINDSGHDGIIKIIQTTMAQIYEDYFEEIIPQEILKPIVKMVIPLLASNKDRIDQDLPIYVPSNKCILRKTDEVKFKDVNWLEENKEEFVHPDIPHIYSVQLGIQQLFGDYLSNKRIGIAWGQHEEIATRIKNILGGYSEHIDVVKELIQNADDAKATKIEFILDKRVHQEEKVFSPKWRDMQGPALIAVNDGVFTEKDLTGIQSLGVGSKREEIHKIGAYGVGFNSVFQLTDCPSFMVDTEKRNVLVVFDPSRSCLECSTHEEPGILIENARKEINEKFTDLKSTFFFNRGFPGSNFFLRLPLRLRWESNSLAKMVDQVLIDSLVKTVYEDGEHYLLFSKHLRRISLKIIEEDKHVSFKREIIAKKLNLEDPLNTDEFVNYPKRESQFMMKQENYELCIKKIDGRNLQSMHWQLFTQTGFDFRGDEDIKESLPHSHKYPEGAIAVFTNNKNCKNCKRFTKRCDQKSRTIICCGLPIPIVNTMPVSINGSFILDYETRRSLWNNVNISHERDWNNHIMKYCVAPCYVNFLVSAAEKLELFNGEDLERKIENYFSAFPYMKRHNETSCRKTSIDLYMKELCNAVYKYLYHNEKAVFPVVIENKIECHPPFNDITGSGFLYVPESMNRYLEDNLKTVGFTIRSLPHHIEQSFHLLPKITPVIARAKISQLRTDEINKLTNSDTILDLLKYCLSEEFDLNTINELPLCLVQDNTLRRFSIHDPIYFVKNPQMFKGSIFEKKFVAEGAYDIIHRVLEGNEERRLYNELEGACDILRRELEKSEEIRQLKGLKSAYDVIQRALEKSDEKRLPKGLYGASDKLHKELGKIDEKSLPKGLKDAYNIILRALKESEETRLPEGLREFSLHDLRMCLLHEFENINISSFIESSQIGLDSKRLEEIWEFILEKVDIDKIHESIMKNICLVPALKKGIPVLVDISKIKCVINMYISYPKENPMLVNLGKCLKNVGVLEAQKIFQNKSKTKPISLIKKLAGSIESTLDVIDAMLLAQIEISVKDAEIIQSYISSKIDILKKDQIIPEQIMGSIRSLSIFIKNNGELTNLQTGVLLVKDGTSPDDGIWKIENQFECELLRFKKEYRKLYDALGIEILDDTNFYIKYVMRKAELLTIEEVNVHINFIIENLFDHIPRHRENELKNAMANAYCFRTRNKGITTTTLLFDPRNKIFEAMLGPDSFPATFYTEEFLTFMNEIGMNSEVTEELFLDFAVSLISFTDMVRRREASELLVSHLVATPSLNRNEEFLMKLKTICFIPPKILEKSLESLHRSKNCERDLISFEGSVVSDLTNLVWTNHYILPYREDSFGDDMTKFLMLLGVKSQLSIHNQPANLSIEDVLHHMNNVTKDISFKMVSNTCKIIPLLEKERIAKIFTSFYEKLLRLPLDKCPCKLRKEFCQSAWVLVNDSKMLDIPKNTLLDEQHSVVPFYNVVAFKNYQSVFEHFGFSQNCNISNYARVLEEIKSDSEEGFLNPNQKEASTKCIEEIARLLKSENDASEVKTLYVPSIKITNKNQVFLCKSTNVCYDVSALSRFKEFEHAVLKADLLVQLDLQYNLPDHLKLFSFDADTKEVLDENDIMVIPDELSKEVIKKLNCPLFLHYLKFMFQVEVRSKEDHPHKDWVEIYGIITSVKICMLSTVKTYIKYKGERIEDSDRCKPYFVERCSIKFVFYYIYPENKYIFYSDFSRELLEFLQLKEFTLLSSLFPSILTQPSSEIGSFLKSRNVNIDVDLVSNPLRSPYRPGEYVPREHYSFLERTFDEFYESEIIALGRTDEDGDECYYIYAKVIERIEDVECDRNVTLSRYKVKIGDEEEDIAVAYEMYHFKKYSKLLIPPSEPKIVPSEEDENNEKQTTDIKLKIDKIFKEIEGLSDSEKQKVLIRLCLRWHPDENPPHLKSLAEEILKYIKNNFKDKKVMEKVLKWIESSPLRKSQPADWEEKSDDTSDSSESVDELPIFDIKNPQPAEAIRWYRQAKCDINSITTDIEGNNFVWACFKAHQAAEKALKAAQYNIDFNRKVFQHHLPSIGSRDDLGSTLMYLSSQLENLLGSSTKMRYPDNWNPPTIPQDHYDAEKAVRAHEIVKKIMKIVDEQIN